MNERIKELDSIAQIETDTEVPVFFDDYIEKLVHIVVWECASIYGKIHNVDIDSDEYIQALNKAFWDDEE